LKGGIAMKQSEHIRKPEWLKVDIGRGKCKTVNRTLQSYGLNSVCEQAGCPNRGECFSSGTATFMLLGKNCTRNCTFCKVTSACPEPLDPDEPKNVALAAKSMGLHHVVLTSVTRDDLPDGGAGHFAATINAVKELAPDISIEVLIPDFQGSESALRTVLNAGPDILNHNVETIPDFYSFIRPQAIFSRSIELLKIIPNFRPEAYVKSGFMVGLGESEEQVAALLKTLKESGCDIVTIGQYLQPSRLHYPVQEYVHPDQFAKYKEIAANLGIPCVASGPLVRSSYHADQDLAVLKQKKSYQA